MQNLISDAKKYIEGIIVYVIAQRKIPLKVFDLIRQIKREKGISIREIGLYQIYMAVKKTEKVDGDIAEVGVYKGSSAKFICEASKKPVHLFDTFEGLPELCENDDTKQFYKGEFSTQFQEVKDYLKNYSNVRFYKGLFPSTAKSIESKDFSFVHLDLDIYESTSAALNFFYPKMSKGGIIISHDYPGAAGVKKAVDDFFENKPEIVIELLPFCEQCLIVKV